MTYLGDKNITKESLLRLKSSKPIPVICHTGETIVPCIYTEKVNAFMKKEGMKLPLSHHFLARAKEVAHTLKGKAKMDSESEEEEDSHATGRVNLSKKKAKKRKPGKKASKKVAQKEPVRPTHVPGIAGQAVMSWGGGGQSPAQALFQQLPSTWQNFRPLSTQTPQVFTQRDFGEEAKKAHEEEKRAMEKYKKELDQRHNQLKEQEQLQLKWNKEHNPLVEPPAPLRPNDFDTFNVPSSSIPKKSEVIIEEESDDEHFPVVKEVTFNTEADRKKEEKRAEEEAERLYEAQSKQAAKESMTYDEWVGRMTRHELEVVTRKINHKLKEDANTDLIASAKDIKSMNKEALKQWVLSFADYLDDIKNA
jgi:hypothetical protein